MARFYLSATRRSSGKTTLGIGLCAAMHRLRGWRVQPFKKGPDYIDPLWLGSAAGRACHNLDFHVQTEDEIVAAFARYTQAVDVAMIEGNTGLFDGVALDGSDSNAAMAALLETPVVLVMDCRGITRGIAPLLLGYQQFTPRVTIGGVILNRVGSSRHESKLRQAVEHYTDIPVLGAVPEAPQMQIVERHLGLMPSNEHEAADKVIDRISAVVADHVDLDALLSAAAGPPPLPGIDEPRSAASGAGVPLRIGIPRDDAFGFYYAADLEKLESQGAELVFFDSLHDPQLPERLDGLFIGGGFPEERMEALEANAGLRGQIADFALRGGPVYAECGGLMYLCRHLVRDGKACKMVGLIPADAVMDTRPQGRGYVLLSETGNSPWPVEPGARAEIPAHEFHYSHLDNIEGRLTFAYRVLRGHGIDGRHDGIVFKNVLAGYTHLRDVAGVHWTRRFLDLVKRCKLGGGDGPTTDKVDQACSR